MFRVDISARIPWALVRVDFRLSRMLFAIIWEPRGKGSGAAQPSCSSTAPSGDTRMSLVSQGDRSWTMGRYRRRVNAEVYLRLKTPSHY
jgi:hypothetical protein